MSKRRTNPAYLSDDEAARDRARTVELVKSITGPKHVNSFIVNSKETKPAWYMGRLCDSCGIELQMESWRCKKCDIGLCYKCNREISYILKRSYFCCPMCGGRLE